MASRIAARAACDIPVLYHCVQFGKTILWVSADLIAFYILVHVAHLATRDVTLVMVGSLLWHAISDLAVGRWLARRTTDSRSLAIATGIAVPIASAAFVLSLLTASRMPSAALGLMMVSRSAYAVFDVPHQALAGRMARLGSPPIRTVGIRNIVGQLAAVVLGIVLTPVLDPAMTAADLGAAITTIGIVSATLCAPIVLLIAHCWTASDDAGTPVGPVAHRSRHAILVMLLGHLTTTILVATASKIMLDAVTPGLTLAILSLGRIGVSIPWPWPARGHAPLSDAHVITAGGWLLVAIVSLAIVPGMFSLLAFGMASGRINVLIWAWLSEATGDAIVFGRAGMLAKIGTALSTPIAAISVA